MASSAAGKPGTQSGDSRRRLLIGLSLGVLSPLSSLAQERPKIPRIGFLGATSASGIASRLEAFLMGLRDLGYVEGKHIVIEYRWADGQYDRLPELAAELARLKVDVVVTYGTPGTLAAKRAVTTIPIVMMVSGDALATGLVKSLAQPGGNITGSTFFVSELMAKRLELLKEAVPRIAQVGVLLNQDNAANGPVLQAMELVARSLKVGLRPFMVRGPHELDGAFSAMAKRRVDGVVLFEDGMMISNARTVADLAAKQRLPTSGPKDFVEVGSLVGYGVRLLDLYRRAAYFVDKILKGAKPGDLPVEQATKFELVINLKTANELGVIIPPSLMLRADQAIN